MQWPAIRFHLHLKGIGSEDGSRPENVQNVQNVQFVPHAEFICLLYQTSFVCLMSINNTEVLICCESELLGAQAYELARYYQ